MLLLGIDLGSSSVKASVLDGDTGLCVASSSSPADEMKINAPKAGWAEQDPSEWWNNLKNAIAGCRKTIGNRMDAIGAIGISYQMHGLVITDKNKEVLRPSIIWCDSRAVSYGEKARKALGNDFCLTRLLNSPGNFTASKLAWVKENEPEIFGRIHKIMLPGDYIGMCMTGDATTTWSGLSEGIFWDFTKNKVSGELMNFFGYDESLLCPSGPGFSVSGHLLKSKAEELGLPSGIPVSYKAGDQPNNALSLNVLNPGEVAATAGTSGVIYGVTDKAKADRESRVNTFLHVNHTPATPRLGVLLCINGTGILNSWLRRNTGETLSYEGMNDLAAGVSPGSEGLLFHPFGNGAERMLGNKTPGASMSGLNFNTHTKAHIYRAAQEGIAFSFRYGLDIMRESAIEPGLIRAGMANMFLSKIFREAVANVTNVPISLFNTDGSLGAARGAGIGCGLYKSEKEAFSGLKTIGSQEPSKELTKVYAEAYEVWRNKLDRMMA
jgi:xylulokinase